MSSDTAHTPYPSVAVDLAEGGLLRMQDGERLWKLYLLRPAASGAGRAEHRIYTKEQADGRIGLVSFGLVISPIDRLTRTQLAYARDIPKGMLDQLIWNVVRQSQLRPEELDVIDLTHLASFEEQIDYLTASEHP